MKFKNPLFLCTFAAELILSQAQFLSMKSVFLKYITGFILLASFLVGSIGNDILIHIGSIDPVLKEYVLDSESKNADASSEDSKENTEKGNKEGAEYISSDHTDIISPLLCTEIITTTYISYSPQSIFFPVPTPPPDLT